MISDMIIEEIAVTVFDFGLWSPNSVWKQNNAATIAARDRILELWS